MPFAFSTMRCAPAAPALRSPSLVDSNMRRQAASLPTKASNGLRAAALMSSATSRQSLHCERRDRGRSHCGRDARRARRWPSAEWRRRPAPAPQRGPSQISRLGQTARIPVRAGSQPYFSSRAVTSSWKIPAAPFVRAEFAAPIFRIIECPRQQLTRTRGRDDIGRAVGPELRALGVERDEQRWIRHIEIRLVEENLRVIVREGFLEPVALERAPVLSVERLYLKDRRKGRERPRRSDDDPVRVPT